MALRGADITSVAKSDSIVMALDIANRIATSRLTILIPAETGIGKELFARLIPAHLPSQAIVAINCGGLAATALDCA